jgi:hypothetical protein
MERGEIMEIKNIRTLTAFVEINGIKKVGYKTYFEFNGKLHNVETFGNNQEMIDKKIKEYVESLGDISVK